MKKRRGYKKGICLGLAAGLTLAACFAPQAAVSKLPPSYLKSVTYVSDAWVINFWNTESDHMDEELAQIAADGFNSIILVIPWREFQPGMSPVSYNQYAFEKLDRIMRAAEEHGLWVELRVSYTWDYYGEEESRLRFQKLLGDEKLEQAWLEYVEKLYVTASAYPNFHGGFITWEDFWNYMEDSTYFGTGKESRAEAQRIGFTDYLEQHYTLEEVMEYYKPVKPFTSYRDIYMPQKTSPAYKLLFEFYDAYLMRLLHAAQQVFPNLSMEVRLDVDPVSGKHGGTVGAHHFRTFPCGSSDHTSLMYSVSMGQENKGETISAATALAAMDSQLNLVKMYNGGKPIYIEQLLYTDSTEEFSHNAQLEEAEVNLFITSLPDILRKYTNGYGVWSYWNYTNNPLYNSQFALDERGWDTNRAKVVERDGSRQMRIGSGGQISQKIGSRITGKLTHSNHVRFTADSDAPATITVKLGRVTKEVQVNGRGQFDLDFGRLNYDKVEFRAGKEVYVDNIHVYNFVQDGKLHDLDNDELGSICAIRTLNASID